MVLMMKTNFKKVLQGLKGRMESFLEDWALNQNGSTFQK